MSVATDYPLRIDGNGRVWGRPKFTGNTPPGSQWGWTATPGQHHESYDEGPPATCMVCGVRTFDEHACTTSLSQILAVVPDDLKDEYMRLYREAGGQE